MIATRRRGYIAEAGDDGYYEGFNIGNIYNTTVTREEPIDQKKVGSYSDKTLFVSPEFPRNSGQYRIGVGVDKTALGLSSSYHSGVSLQANFVYDGTKDYTVWLGATAGRLIFSAPANLIHDFYVLDVTNNNYLFKGKNLL